MLVGFLSVNYDKVSDFKTIRNLMKQKESEQPVILGGDNLIPEKFLKNLNKLIRPCSNFSGKH